MGGLRHPMEPAGRGEDGRVDPVPPVAPTPAAPPATAPEPGPGAEAAKHGAGTLALTLGALGVVYGDIGTSPLYAFKLCFHGHSGLALGEPQVLGVLSLFFWALTCVVTVQYLAFMTRADNRGEGGIFSLLALVPEQAGKRSRWVVVVALAGAALLYGDGIITPAISVLSAVEGLEVATPAARPYVVPLAVAILLALFLVQSRGTGRIGRVFGPVMLLWFGTIAVLGAVQVVQAPGVLRALNPLCAVHLFHDAPLAAFTVLGAVVLCITGAEALYADMGHFGRPAIQRAWLLVAFPALLLCYLGQGALVLRDPKAIEAPFFALVPGPLLYPMVGLATLATVIASQALISGVFSLTRQAMQLGFLPRLNVVHTSSLVEGQIYLPLVNYMLMVACLFLVVEFGESERLAAAYGISITAAMLSNALVYGVVLRRRLGWPLAAVLGLVGFFLATCGSFFASCLLKLVEGGWIPLVMAAALFVVMDTWKTGRTHLLKRFAQRTLPLDDFVHDLKKGRLARVPGSAVFLSSTPRMTPVAMLHHVRQSKALHEHVLVLCFVTEDVPSVARAERYVTRELGAGVWFASVRLGFMESPNVVGALKELAEEGVRFPPSLSTYYLSRETLVTTGPAPLMRWRKQLFAFTARNAQTPSTFFGLPPGQVVELGAQVDL
ncbi:MAG: potassium transporter Kup [Planctomycetia bacterium]